MCCRVGLECIFVVLAWACFLQGARGQGPKDCVYIAAVVVARVNAAALLTCSQDVCRLAGVDLGYILHFTSDSK